MRRYYVAPCDEGEGKRRTRDVMERAHYLGTLRSDEATAVSNHATRDEARRVCEVENLSWKASQG